MVVCGRRVLGRRVVEQRVHELRWGEDAGWCCSFAVVGVGLRGGGAESGWIRDVRAATIF